MRQRSATWSEPAVWGTGGRGSNLALRSSVLTNTVEDSMRMATTEPLCRERGKRETGSQRIEVGRWEGGKSGSWSKWWGCPASVSERCASRSFRERSVLELKIAAVLVDHFLRLKIDAQAGAVHVAI